MHNLLLHHLGKNPKGDPIQDLTRDINSTRSVEGFPSSNQDQEGLLPLASTGSIGHDAVPHRLWMIKQQISLASFKIGELGRDQKKTKQKRVKKWLKHLLDPTDLAFTRTSFGHH
jgi:hypothetical protein